MKQFYTANFTKKLKRLCKKDHQLKIAFEKQLTLFDKNPQHPSLRTHKLRGERDTQYAIWIQDDLRAVFVKEKDGYIFFEIVTHDEY